MKNIITSSVFASFLLLPSLVFGQTTDSPDTTAPSVSIVSPQPATVMKYTRGESILLQATLSDSESGVAYGGFAFQGRTMTNGTVLDTYFEKPGQYTLTAFAYDMKSNKGEVSIPFEIVVTSESLMSDFERTLSMRLITNPSVREAIRSKLKTIQKQQDTIDAFNKKWEGVSPLPKAAAISLAQMTRILKGRYTETIKIIDSYTPKYIFPVAASTLKEELTWLGNN